jgi:hypothetical protein
MREIGGFFELELIDNDTEWHKNALALNSGRNCLRYIVRKKKFKRIFVPNYTCMAVYDVMSEENVEVINYSLDESFMPIDICGQSDFVLYTNYFGVCGGNVKKLINLFPKLIVDCAQAFYYIPPDGVDAFYSPRKFFGVPDGGYLYTEDVSTGNSLINSVSYNKIDHLMKRIDVSANEALDSYRKNETIFENESIMKMSKLTKRILNSVDYNRARKKRLENFSALHAELSKYNNFEVKQDIDDVPMVYPFLVDNTRLRKRLIENKIYAATYWPDIINRIPERSFESTLVNNLIPLPIDQRYDAADMAYVAGFVKRNIVSDSC